LDNCYQDANPGWRFYVASIVIVRNATRLGTWAKLQNASATTN
jgi:hypothetical protein